MDDIQVVHWLMRVEQIHYSYSNDCPKQLNKAINNTNNIESGLARVHTKDRTITTNYHKIVFQYTKITKHATSINAVSLSASS